MRTKAVGVALHYFDANAGQNGSDKFYRIYLYQGGYGTYEVLSHWGRDGAVNGQSKVVKFDNFHDAKEYAEKLGNSKHRKGYEWLGENEIDLDLSDLWYTGQRLVKATGRTPTKMAGFSLVIQEEADLMELLGL